jgi:hypothetical protein
VADLLRPFEIKPKDIRTPDGTKRGYDLGVCKDAFERYLPRNPDSKCDAATKPPETASESQKRAPHEVRQKAPASHFENPQKRLEQADVADVALSEGPTGENGHPDDLSDLKLDEVELARIRAEKVPDTALGALTCEFVFPMPMENDHDGCYSLRCAKGIEA